MSQQMMDMQCSMKMYFHFGNECILFKNWIPTDIIQLLSSCIGLFALCFVRELTLYIRQYYEISTLSGIFIPFWPTKKKKKKKKKVVIIYIKFLHYLLYLNNIHNHYSTFNL
eukprot:538962_1